MFSFNGFNQNFLTFATESLIDVGTPVKMSKNGTVATCDLNDVFVGFIAAASDDAASVQLTGHATVSYSGTAPELGYVSVCADGNGGIEIGTGRNVIVVSVNSTDNTCEIIL